MLHEHNTLIQDFKTALDVMPDNNYNIIIRANKKPRNEHELIYNAPTVNDIAIIVCGN